MKKYIILTILVVLAIAGAACRKQIYELLNPPKYTTDYYIADEDRDKIPEIYAGMPQIESNEFYPSNLQQPAGDKVDDYWYGLFSIENIPHIKELEKLVRRAKPEQHYLVKMVNREVKPNPRFHININNFFNKNYNGTCRVVNTDVTNGIYYIEIDTTVRDVH